MTLVVLCFPSISGNAAKVGKLLHGGHANHAYPNGSRFRLLAALFHALKMREQRLAKGRLGRKAGDQKMNKN
ncbi:MULTISPECIES: hypothetical protein [unclassified Devosia]|uniref:hypothetical protein n=1 Tax=unclassified Devosia TaxID=196773 RepID=UPI00138F3F6D|nr:MULTISPECIES: hypothetical protein [unclassified Devosia]